MTKIPIYDKNGILVNQIEIDDNLVHVDGRIQRGTKHYYKGLGGEYKNHYVTSEFFNPEEYQFNSDSGIFYQGYDVSKYNFKDKSGIFQERFAPQFSDFINTCGIREISIIENSMFFKKSSVDVIKAVNYDRENSQYYYILDYKCGRRKYLNGGFPKKLKQLIEYMIENDWCMIWDKNSISDISYNGLITDVADIFHSTYIVNKVGTVYSILYSLGKNDFNMYLELIKQFRLSHSNDMYYVLNTIEILKKSGVDVSEMIISEHPHVNYQHIVLNYVVNGKNCGDCIFPELGDRVRNQHIENAMKGMR